MHGQGPVAGGRRGGLPDPVVPDRLHRTPSHRPCLVRTHMTDVLGTVLPGLQLDLHVGHDGSASLVAHEAPKDLPPYLYTQTRVRQVFVKGSNARGFEGLGLCPAPTDAPAA